MRLLYVILAVFISTSGMAALTTTPANTPVTTTTSTSLTQPAATHFGKDFAKTDADKQLNDKIRSEISEGWFSKGYDTIVLNTTDGVVVITGFVNSLDDANDLMEQIKEIEGVRSVDSQLQINNPNS